MIRRYPFIDLGLRKAVYDYDGYRCLNCGSGQLSLDHIVPRILGGPDTFENLQTLCTPCNSRKGCAPFVLPRPEKKPKPPQPKVWRPFVTKAVLIKRAPTMMKAAKVKRTPKRPQRRHYWEMMAIKHPLLFSPNQIAYAPRDRLRLRNLIGPELSFVEQWEIDPLTAVPSGSTVAP